MGSERRSYRALAETVHLTAVAAWLGAVMMAGVAAAVSFPTMKALEPTLGVYAVYEGEHWRLAAGHVADNVFKISELIQFLAATLTLLTFIMLVAFLKLPLRSWVSFGRAAGLGAGMLLLSYLFFVLGPRMNANLADYREAARAGEMETATRYQQAFNDDHPTASNVYSGLAVSTLFMLVFGVWSAAMGKTEDDTPAAGPGSGTTLQKPALAG